MEITPRRRRALATVLALVLAIESVSAVGAAAVVTTRSAAAGPRHDLPAAAVGGAVLVRQVDAVVDAVAAAPARADVGVPKVAGDPAEVPDAPAVRPTPRPKVVAASIPARAPRAAAPKLRPPVVAASSSGPSRSGTSGGTSSGATTAGGGSKSSGAVSYTGRNRVWIPSLGINRSVNWFSCDRQRPPDNYVYRWGCAGSNNVYLMGHAHSVFKPLHDAYVSGRLRVGMKAYYADAKGNVRVYKVKWWKTVKPTTAASWAWAAQSVPSMTLQTCVGANSEYRLMVRLVAGG